MPTVTETQVYLDEVKIPTVIAPALVNNAFKALVQPVGDASQQVAKWAKLLRDSELAEPDAVLLGKYEQTFQKFGALVRELGQVEAASRDVTRSYRDFLALDAEMRTIATGLGYTV